MDPLRDYTEKRKELQGRVREFETELLLFITIQAQDESLDPISKIALRCLCHIGSLMATPGLMIIEDFLRTRASLSKEQQLEWLAEELENMPKEKAIDLMARTLGELGTALGATETEIIRDIQRTADENSSPK